MTRLEFQRWAKLRGRRRCTSAVFLDDDGLIGTIRFHPYWREIIVTHRWTRTVLLREEVWPWHPAFEVLVRKWTDYVAQFVKRIERGPEGGTLGDRAMDEVLAGDYPALHEHLTLDWLEGSKRETSTLGISVDGGRWKARLADRDNGLVAFVSGDGFYAVLGALERALADGTADWREDQYAAKRPATARKQR